MGGGEAAPLIYLVPSFRRGLDRVRGCLSSQASFSHLIFKGRGLVRSEDRGGGLPSSSFFSTHPEASGFEEGIKWKRE